MASHPLQDYASTTPSQTQSQSSSSRLANVDEDMGNPNEGPAEGLGEQREERDLELQGLLSGQSKNERGRTSRHKKRLALYEWLEDDEEIGGGWSRRRLTSVAGVLILLLLGAALLRPLIAPKTRTRTHPNSEFKGAQLRSNGTHDFRRTVLIFSIDGLRADYLDRGLTPHLLDISKKGLRAKYMKPIFPTLTFPNHWALMTGLYAESHGIVANNFWDPVTDTEFHYNKESSTWNPRWWLGEPMWETAGRAGVITANLMWPGPPKTTTGASPTYFVPWKDKVPLGEKLDQLCKWIDMPLDERPQLIMGYEPSLDQAGHSAGPNSTLVNDTLKYVDGFARELHKQLEARNLSEIVDVIFVSDHGMTDTSHPELVYMDDILGAEGIANIEHEDGWPSAGLRFSRTCNASHYLHVLRSAAQANAEKFDVYTRETMPPRYHFAENERIAPVYVIPKIGYALTTHAEGDSGLSKGNHGYDNDEPSMFATFVAHGPFATNVKDVHERKTKRRTKTKRAPSFLLFPGLSLSRREGSGSEGWHSVEGSTYVMNGFENVQIYGLVMKLLGLEDWSARNNGTKGFWDKYF